MSGTLEDSIANWNGRIRKQKARIEELHRRIDLPENFRPTIGRNGPAFHPTKGRAHLIGDRLHQEEILADFERERDRCLLELAERNRRFHPIQGDEPTTPASTTSASKTNKASKAHTVVDKPLRKKSLKMAVAEAALKSLWIENPNVTYKEMLSLAQKRKVMLPWADAQTWVDAYGSGESRVKTLFWKARTQARAASRPSS